jgi:methyltransferase-like protein
MEKQPALITPVPSNWIQKAMKFLQEEPNSILFLPTNSRIQNLIKQDIKSIYFKEKWHDVINFKANLICYSSSSPKEFILLEDYSSNAKLYLGFSNLRKIEPIIIRNIKYNSTKKRLQNNFRGVCLIEDLLEN